MFETRFLQLVHLCGFYENCSIRLRNNFYEITDHLQEYRADKLSSFFQQGILYVFLG